jgi:anti-sigma regulatory factor (Ser/Thr protein kinase)
MLGLTHSDALNVDHPFRMHSAEGWSRMNSSNAPDGAATPVEPVEVDRLLVSLSLRSDCTAPRQARLALRDFPELDEIHDDATLVVSELMSNAVMHSGATRGDLITLSVFVDAVRVRIHVHDPARTGLIPRIREHQGGQGGGLGLQLVNQIARRWGTEPAAGRIVWADLAFPISRAGRQASRPRTTTLR